MTPNKLLSPSASFKKEATKSIIAIVAFMLVYLLLIAASVALVIGSFYAGIAIVSLRVSLYTLLAGLGIIGAGVMVFVFLVKFMFSSKDEDNSDSIEITADDHPRLFAAINELAEQTGTRKPKKVFLSPDVNACVFYHSSFWSMFLPIRKNLKIGLGLINAVNTSELKAVIAHEFGHFSQRSMKLGSWVYQVNKIIYDMLYNNTSYTESLGAMNRIHGIVSIFVQITVGIVRAIQWVLRQMFTIVNKSYLGLSRQMEFHADLVASSVAGSNNIISSLRRVEFAEAGYQTTIHLCNIALKKNQVVSDFYSNHEKVLHHIAGVHGFSLANGLPQPLEKNGATNRVNFKNQWASHPTVEEREAYLKPFALEAAVESEPAWSLLNDSPTWKQRLTSAIYASVPGEEKKTTLEAADFEALLTDNLKQFSFPEFYGEYYDTREIKLFDVDAVADAPYTIQLIDTWFTDEEKSWPKRLQYIDQDLAVLDAIDKGNIDTNSFDFDGRKYKKDKAVEVTAILKQEKEELLKQIAALDEKLFRHAAAVVALDKAEELKKGYKAYFNLRKEGEAFLDIANNMMKTLSPVFAGQTISVTQITLMINDLKAKHEPVFKKELALWMERGIFDEDETLKNKINNYRNANWVYFFDGSFMDTELNSLHTIVQESWACLTNHIFIHFRKLATSQAQCLEVKKTVQL